MTTRDMAESRIGMRNTGKKILKSNNQLGLSFMEIVISTVILLIVFFTVFQIFTLGYRYYRQSQDSTELIKLAQQQMEQISRDQYTTGADWEFLPGSSNRFEYKVEVASTFYPYDDQLPKYDPPGPNPTYYLYQVCLIARGPLEPDRSLTSVSKNIYLTTIVTPQQEFFATKCGHDEYEVKGASSLWEGEPQP